MHPFESFLQQMAYALNIAESLVADSELSYSIFLEKAELALLFEWEEQWIPSSILLSSPLGLVPEKSRFQVYRACLSANRELEETLSIKEGENILYLHCRFHPAIDKEQLTPLVHHFIAQAGEWRSELERLSKWEKTSPSSGGRESYPPPPHVFKHKI